MCVFCTGTIDSQPVTLCRKCGCCRRHCECYGTGEPPERLAIHTTAAIDLVRRACETPATEWLRNLNVPETDK